MKYNILLLAFAFVLSCKPAAEQPATENTATDTMKTESTVDKTGPEYTSAYICPMHCKGSGSDKPGVCPACGMDYVINDKNAENHDGHDHEGHDHEDHEGHSH